MKCLTNKEWWHWASIRAIKTIAQAAISILGASIAFSEVDWRMALSASLFAGVLSLLTSVAGIPEVKDPTIDTEE